MEMKWNSSHQGDDDGSEVPDRESKRRSSLADVVGDAIRQRDLQRMEAMMRRVVREEVEKIVASFHHSSSRSSFDPSQRRGFQLHFDGKLPVTLYTCSRIESEDRKPVKIVIYDASNKIISAGPPSSMKVEIVPLDGDFGANDQGEWTEQEFNAKILHARQGKRQLVTGKSVIRLRNGVGYINNVSFTDNSRWIRNQKFRLGARAVSSNSNEVRIREARSEPFRVKDLRGESYKKHHPPNLGDEIWRLEKISKGSDSRKRLSENGITTIQHFLKEYYMDPSSLRGLLGRISDKRWKTITEHATACVPDDKLYTYHREGETLVFNSIFKVVGGIIGGQIYRSCDELYAVHKDLVDNMTRHAYKNMNDFVQLDQPWLFHSLPSNLLADLFANPIASLQHSNFAGLTQDQLDIPLASNLFASPEHTDAAQDYSLPESSVAPYFHPTATSLCNNWPPWMQIGENYEVETSTWERNGWFSSPSRGGAGGIMSPKSGRPKARWFMVRAALKWVMSRCSLGASFDSNSKIVLL
ncbi:calmodulin-binding protein 60 B-like isoform X2 [Diospyros lotus]|uniref:calmodulin-binding protein 60 B-like isoform X2 n=1 Tax=Diospyros lotus TaxID=55363 RepID=UPI002257D2DE|nr:calmodulin-binding protein 60 B-like isoform X2 [Diospyros lotus]